MIYISCTRAHLNKVFEIGRTAINRLIVEKRIKGIISELDSLEYCRKSPNQVLEKALLVHKYAKNSQSLCQLDYRINALQSRMGLREKKASSQRDQSWLAEVSQWKASQTYYRDGNFDEKQEANLELSMQYPEFIKMLRKHENLKNSFLEWSVRDYNNPEIFMHYPDISKRIAEVEFAAKTGFYNLLHKDGENLFLKCQGQQSLDLRDINAKVSLALGYVVNFTNILDCFRNRSINFGRLDATPEGVINWSAHYFGPYDPKTGTYQQIDFNKPDWWTQQPIENEFTPAQLQSRYHMKKLPDGQSWYFTVAGSTGSNREILVGDTHGLVIVAIPLPNGNYAEHTYGKYTYEDFPVTTWQKLCLILKVVRARINSPDGSMQYFKRDKEFITFKKTPEKAYEKMEEIKQDILLGLKGEIPFQLFSLNCLDWAAGIVLTAVQRSVCYIKPIEADVKGSKRIALKIYHMLPRILTKPILNLFAWFFGGYNEVVTKTRTGQPVSSRFADRFPWDGYESANPSVMLLRLRNDRKNWEFALQGTEQL